MILNLYPSIVHSSDLSPDSVGSDVDEICNEIAEAVKGFGTDEDAVIKALATQDAETRSKIAIRYPEVQEGKSLKDVMKSECGKRQFGTALQFLAVPTHEMECDMITKACKGLGTNEKVLYPIICGRSNDEISILKKKYFDHTGNDLGRMLDSELGGDMEKLIFNCLQGAQEEFDPDFHNDELVEQDVQAIYDAGQGSFGTNEAGFFKIVIARPEEHLKTVNLAYAEKHGFTLFMALETELKGAVRDASIFTLGMKLKPYETIAKLIKEACAGFGTNELLLTCCLIRYQPVLDAVMTAHVELFEKTVADRIKEETNGDYEKVLLAVIGYSEE